MQTILGANGQIGQQLAKELHQNYTQQIRLVSRNPKKVNPTDELFAANLLDAAVTQKALEGSQIVYFTAGLPMNSRLWKTQFPAMMQNVINGCKNHGCKLVFFDNTYMYAKNNNPQSDRSPFVYKGPKSTVRAKTAIMLMEQMNNKSIRAAICRAPEFYGPDKTKSIIHSLILDKIKKNQTPLVPLTDQTRRTLIWTPDASRAMALIGNTEDAYFQTWHLPCDDQLLTFKEIIALCEEITQKKLSYKILKMWQFRLGGLFKKSVREILELLPRYQHDHIFLSDDFKKRFPEFKVTTYREGLSTLLNY